METCCLQMNACANFYTFSFWVSLVKHGFKSCTCNWTVTCAVCTECLLWRSVQSLHNSLDYLLVLWWRHQVSIVYIIFWYCGDSIKCKYGSLYFEISHDLKNKLAQLKLRICSTREVHETEASEFKKLGKMPLSWYACAFIRCCFCWVLRVHISIRTYYIL